MTSTITRPVGLGQPEFGQALLPRTKAGLVKRRTTRDEKLQILDPTATPERTVARLDAFQRLFAFRRHQAIITWPGQGHRAWTALRGPIYLDHIVRHLLGARIPSLPPQWLGARSFKTAPFFCLDIDADRPPLPALDLGDVKAVLPIDDTAHRIRVLARLQGRTQRLHRPKPPFTLRCQQVDDALRRLGIDPADPTQLLVYPSPSGGRHVYVFFDQLQFLEQYGYLLRDAGLSFAKGEIEFFPSTSHGLRLPFGHLPGLPHDPRAWIRFIDAFQTNRIKRHSLQQLYEILSASQHHPPASLSSAVPAPTNATPARRQAGPMGLPRRHRQESDVQQLTAQQANERFLQIIEQGPQSAVEAETLLALGIRLPGKRTETLRHLAAHFIWVRGLATEAAAVELTAWAMDRRHNSKDIQEDLDRGTDVVAQHIARMCRSYAQYNDGRFDDRRVQRGQDSRPQGLLYSPAEIEALRPHVQALAPDQRLAHANFLLHFLAYAKEHGGPAAEGNGLVAAPAVNAVIKHWRDCGCHHGHYQERIEQVLASGVLTLAKAKWQNPHGKGRARTFRLAVPIVLQEYWVLDYQNALASLTNDAPSGASELATSPLGAQVQASAVGTEADLARSTPAEENTCNERSPDLAAADPSSSNNTAANRTNQPADLRAAGAGVGVDPRPRECPQEPPASPGLSGQGDGRLGAVQPGTPSCPNADTRLEQYIATERRRLADGPNPRAANPRGGVASGPTERPTERSCLQGLRHQDPGTE